MKTPMKMLTADRIGLGLVAFGMIGAVVNVPALGLIGLGVLGPTLLREAGWLKDDDDFTRQAAHRAGFHAMVLTMVLLVANRLLLRMAASLPPGFGPNELYFPIEGTIQTGLGLFAISYVMQYWGVRIGAVRVLIGLAVLALLNGVSNLLITLRFDRPVDSVHLLVILGVAAAILALAWLTARRPRVGGSILLLVLAAALWGLVREVAGLDSMPEHARNQGMFWALMSGGLSLVVLFGPLGVALLREPSADG